MYNVARNYKNTIQALLDQERLMDKTYNEYFANYMNPSITEVLNSILKRVDTEDTSFIEKEMYLLSIR